MRRKESYRIQAKRAVVTGLFLGVLWGLTGCVKPVVQPGVTNTPVPAPTSGVVPTPVPETPTSVPGVTESPATPTSGVTDVPSGVPVVSPEPSATPTQEPQSTVTAPLAPSGTPTPELSPEVTPIPTPLPTGQPEYDTLLQNGWQRTEDFFGCREIFFSGQFDNTELIASPGRYEYRYTASSDAGITFFVIGEENLPVQLFLDELAQRAMECQIEREGEEDYRYTYTDSDLQVNGRVYACGDGQMNHRMRIEFCSPLASETQTEGYGFYLRETIKGE